MSRERRPEGRISSVPVTADPAFLEQPHGVVLWSQGKTKVLCTATVQEGVPRWLHRSGRGWMTAEYSLLPASTGERTDREAARGKQGGRTVEIQRLIGRALRGVVDFQALGERTVYLDCDVLQADGGTRCAAITGAYVAAQRALDRFGLSKALTGSVAAVSVGVVDGVSLLDLDYSEDSNADVDVNVVMTGDGRFVEVQSTAEQVPFDRARLDELLDLAAAGIDDLQQFQQRRSPHRATERASARGDRLLRQPPQARGVRHALSRLGPELLDGAGLPEENGDDLSRQRADQGPPRPGRRPGRALDARRRLGNRARCARRRPGCRDGSVGRGRHVEQCARRGRGAGPAGAVRVRARARSRPTGASCAARASWTGRSRTRPPGARASASTRSSSRSASRAPSPSSATRGRREHSHRALAARALLDLV